MCGISIFSWFKAVFFAFCQTCSWGWNIEICRNIEQPSSNKVKVIEQVNEFLYICLVTNDLDLNFKVTEDIDRILGSKGAKTNAVSAKHQRSWSSCCFTFSTVQLQFFRFHWSDIDCSDKIFLIDMLYWCGLEWSFVYMLLAVELGTLWHCILQLMTESQQYQEFVLHWVFCSFSLYLLHIEKKGVNMMNFADIKPMLLIYGMCVFVLEKYGGIFFHYFFCKIC